MTSTEREYLQRLERRIHELERTRFPRGSLVVIPLVAVTLLSAWVPTTGPAVVESRLAALESLIGPGPEGSVQTRTPFQVLDGQGKVIFNVGGRDAAGAVNVTKLAGSQAAFLRVLGSGGQDVANMVVDASGNGRISNFDASGNIVAQFNSGGLNVYNTDAAVVAGVTRGSGTGRVAIWRQGKTAAEITGDADGNGTVSSYAKGKEAVRIGVSQAGHGRVAVNDADGKASAILNEAGLNVYNTEEVRVAGVTRGPDGHGRVVVWHDEGRTAAQLSADKEGNGRILSYGANGKMRIDLNGELGITVMDDAEKGVVSILNRDGQGVVGVKASINNKLTAEMTVDSGGGGILHMKAPDGKTAIGLYAARRVIALGNSQGATVAEMVVNPAGFGLFQVWAGQGKMPLAVLGKSADGFGGILQISNGQSIISSLTVSPGGNGMWQLNDAAGKPVIEAGSIGPVGTIRVGPMMRCLPRPSSLVLPDCLLGRAK